MKQANNSEMGEIEDHNRSWWHFTCYDIHDRFEQNISYIPNTSSRINILNSNVEWYISSQLYNLIMLQHSQMSNIYIDKQWHIEYINLI